MRIILSILIALFFPLTSLFAQEKAWEKMTEKEKQAYMLKMSYEIIQEFGPGYYRADAPYVFETDKYDTGAQDLAKNIGKELCIVKFLYDKSKEMFETDYLAKVAFWADSGKPLDVIFGCNLGITFARVPYEKQKTEKHTVIPFYQATPRFIKVSEKAKSVTGPEEKKIVERCVELIKKYGPDYYNPEANHNIAEAVYRSDGKNKPMPENNGREYYLITFDYDLNKVLMKNYFSAAIRMWKDTGEVWNITFGNGEEFNF